MEDKNKTAEVMDEVNATPKAANDPKVGEPTGAWEKFYKVLGQLNTIFVLRANEDLKGTTNKLIRLTCALDDRCKQYGEDFVWDVPSQRCVRRQLEQ